MEEKDKKENKKIKKPKMNLPDKRILIGIGILLLAVLIGVFAKNNKVNIGSKNASSKEIDDNSYNQSHIYRVDLNQIKTIDFDLSTSDVRIQRSTTNPYVEYTVLYRGEENVYDMDIAFEDGILKLKNKVSGDKLYMKDKIPIVRIFLPMSGALDEIRGKIGAGDIKISDLEVKDFDLDIKNGSISIDNSFFSGNIKNEAGPINLSNTELKNTSLKTVVGNISVVDSKLGHNISLESQTGDIIVNADKGIDSYDIDARLDVGNFILGNRSYRNIVDGFTSENEGKYKISLKTKIGSIIFNRGEGAKLDETEYTTNENIPNDEEEENLEEDLNEEEVNEEEAIEEELIEDDSLEEDEPLENDDSENLEEDLP